MSGVSRARMRTNETLAFSVGQIIEIMIEWGADVFCGLVSMRRASSPNVPKENSPIRALKTPRRGWNCSVVCPRGWGPCQILGGVMFAFERTCSDMSSARWRRR